MPPPHHAAWQAAFVSCLFVGAFGLTENDGHENDGPICEEFAGHEITGHENDRPKLHNLGSDNIELCSSYNSRSCFKVTMNSFCLCDY